MYTCKRCRTHTDYRRRGENPNHKIAQVSQLKAKVNGSTILNIKPNVKLCIPCLKELLKWTSDKGAQISARSPAYR